MWMWRLSLVERFFCPEAHRKGCEPTNMSEILKVSARVSAPISGQSFIPDT